MYLYTKGSRDIYKICYKRSFESTPGIVISKTTVGGDKSSIVSLLNHGGRLMIVQSEIMQTHSIHELDPDTLEIVKNIQYETNYTKY